MVYKSEGKRPLGRPRRRREDDIKNDMKEIGLGGDLFDLFQDGDKWGGSVSSLRKPWSLN